MPDVESCWMDHMGTFCDSRIVRRKELAERLGISEVSVWRWEREGHLPKKRKLGPNVCGWLESELEEWFTSTDPEPEASK